MKKHILAFVLLSTPAALACGPAFGPEVLAMLVGMLFVAALPHLLTPWLASRSVGARLDTTTRGLTYLTGWGTSLFFLVVFHSWLGYWLGLLCSWAVGVSLSRHFHRDLDGPADSAGTGLNQSE